MISLKIFKYLLTTFILVTALFLVPDAHAETQSTYFKGEVIGIEKDGTRNSFGHEIFFQNLKIRFIDGPEKGKETFIENSGAPTTYEAKKLKVGDKLVILSNSENGKNKYSIWDKYRLTPLIYIVIGFFILVIVFAGLKGIGSILGMAISLGTLLLFVVPQIINGKDPLLISIVGSIFIMFASIYLAHGFTKRTSIAIISTFISLVLTGILAFVFVKLAHLTGMGNEESYMLQMGPLNVNIKGLLLGGIIIGTLGVLDDITTSQSAAIEELSKLNTKLSFTELLYRGYRIGREHIASLVNTLVLAYAGASFSLFILFVLNPAKNPYWVILNSEMIAEEIVRTLAGSIGLILAVPITTVIAAWYFVRKRK